VVNASISGDTARGGLARLPATFERHRPSIVVVERDLIQLDGIHPNEQAQPRLLEHLWPSLQPLLEASGPQV